MNTSVNLLAMDNFLHSCSGKIHYLKTWPQYFDSIIHKDPLYRKTVEIRKNDRNFTIGDILVLKEYNVDTGYSGREALRIVTHVICESPWVPTGYIAMSITEY